LLYSSPLLQLIGAKAELSSPRKLALSQLLLQRQTDVIPTTRVPAARAGNDNVEPPFH